MPRLEDLAFAAAEWTVTASGTNAVATATKAAEAGKSHYIAGVSISMSAAPAASVLAEVRENAATAKDQFRIPAAVFAPIVINYVRPIRIAKGLSADVTLPASGTAGVIGTVTIRGFSRT